MEITADSGSALARLRVPAERPFAQLKSWRVQHTMRIGPGRATALLHALFAVIQ
ncbi:hypothetical protein [Streptomyces sp. bgisy084]|uniref:hypothetical protein n=1 Tax=unclassified Streptomyces TaxID=2593676 RepID=UPI003D717CAC